LAILGPPVPNHKAGPIHRGRIKDFLFLHYPKTAGKSLSLAFAEVWSRPVYGLVSKGQITELSIVDQQGLHLTVARGHENICQARDILEASGIDIYALKAIFVGVRNPYDLMVSNYFFMRETFKNNKEKNNFQLAANKNFEDYCSNITMSPPRNWMEIDGNKPKNLHLIRYERLQEDFNYFANKFGFGSVILPHLNRSEHEEYLAYINEASEENIYSLFREIFDAGLYSRIKFKSEREIDRLGT
jgi:hypothetical protein